MQSRWNNLTLEFQRKEHYSAYKFITMLERVHKYMRIGAKIGIHWVPLTFYTPMLLYLVPHWIREKVEECEKDGNIKMRQLATYRDFYLKEIKGIDVVMHPREITL